MPSPMPVNRREKTERTSWGLEVLSSCLSLVLLAQEVFVLQHRRRSTSEVSRLDSLSDIDVDLEMVEC